MQVGMGCLSCPPHPRPWGGRSPLPEDPLLSTISEKTCFKESIQKPATQKTTFLWGGRFSVQLLMCNLNSTVLLYTRNATSLSLKKWSSVDSTTLLKCPLAANSLGAWGHTSFLLSSLLAKSINKGQPPVARKLRETSVKSKPNVLNKEHALLCKKKLDSSRVPCEADMQMVPWVLLQWAYFSWGGQRHQIPTANCPFCQSSKICTGVLRRY